MERRNTEQLYQPLARHSPVSRQPAAAFRDGDLLGNGDIGASVYGSPERFSFSLAKNDLWDTRIEGDKSNLPEGGLARIKKLLEKGDRPAWDTLKKEILFKIRRDYPAPMHGLNLDLELNRGSMFGSFERRLELANGLWSAKFNVLGDITAVNEGLGWCRDRTELRAFIAEENHLFIEYSPFCGAGLDPEYYRPRTLVGPFALRLSFLHKDGVAGPEFSGRDGVQLAGRSLPNGEYYLAGLLTNTPGEHVTTGRLELSIWKDQPAQGRFLAVLKTEKFSRRPGDGETEEFLRQLREAFTAGFEKELERSAAQWRRYWEDGAAVFVEEESVERAWYEDVYLLNTISRPGRFLPGLQGPYTRVCAVPWNGDFHTDCNIEANYWFSYSGNRTETSRPFFDYYRSIVPQAKADTREYYGSERGLKFPQASDPAGHELGGYLSAAIWPGNSGWIAKVFVDYWEYTGDEKFLKEYAWPVLRDVAILYADLAVKLEDGRYHVYPSYLPEWQCSNLESLGYDSPSDVASFRYALDKVLEIAALRPDLAGGIPEGYAGRWREIAGALADYPVSRDGRLLPLKYEGGREPMENILESGFWLNSLFAGIFPMEVVDPEDEKHPVVRAFRQGLKGYLRLRKEGTALHAVGDPYNLWSAWFAVMAARACPDRYWEALRLAHDARFRAGKHITYDIVLEIDGCSSFAAAVNEGFMQSYRIGHIVIGRGLPPGFTGRSERLLARGGVEVSVSVRDGALERLELLGRRDTDLLIDVQVPLRAGLEHSGFAHFEPNEHRIRAAIEAGQPAVLSPG